MPFHLQRVGRKREAQLQGVRWMAERCMMGKNSVNLIISSQTTKSITLSSRILAKTAELRAWTKWAVRLYIILATQTRIQSHSYLLSAAFDRIAIRQRATLASATNMAATLHCEKAEPSWKRALLGKLKNAENKCLLYRMCRPQCAVLVNKWWRGRRPCPAELVSFG